MLPKATLIPTSPLLFFSKNDPEDPRIGDISKSASIETNPFTDNSFTILGYSDDEGIRLNGGRLGASEAPKVIRQFLYKMTPSALSYKRISLFDLGDLNQRPELAERHEDALEITTYLHKRKQRVISFGGGHDYGYADAAGFIQNNLNSTNKPVVINFDAHLDVRPTTHGFNSGTPFYRLLEQYKDQFEFIEIGLQPQCNSIAHWTWAEEKGAHLFDLNSVQKNGLLKLLENPVFKKITSSTPVFISFDIDALKASEAGGCSQAWATGLKIADCLEFLSQLYQKSNVRGLGIYEVSPPLDRDFQTSKTAALLTHHFLFES
ncbi:MAG: formimidoylglutamase [Pseudobdellovibrio sp.]